MESFLNQEVVANVTRHLTLFTVIPRDIITFFCNSCKKKYSVRNGTILSLANISFRKIVFLVYFFITSFLSYKQVRKEVSISSSEDDCDESNGDEEDDDSAKRCIMSNKTISRYYSIFR